MTAHPATQLFYRYAPVVQLLAGHSLTQTTRAVGKTVVSAWSYAGIYFV
jgi:hypothetical protein